ncbi:LacI family DNA-binding transcriptional regulator [Mesorhizobium comanense]|uniref:LacI family DNA-binding transcriptional regulator n=1 Tax=Mesorhizobium comanense TaxID=2502215 RepID=UPI0010FA138A|nr:LacI family DNA-binding transcriptional regulator [Mesorhizobium comanense]
MVTRADVANRAGTSTAVVSYVVNDGPRPVAAETRRRVLEAIAELGYRPNRVAQALRGQRSRVLGLIVPDISNPFYAELARVIENCADLDGYTLVLGNSEQDAQRELRYVRTFLDRQVDGLFLISGSSSEELMALFSEIAVPFILLDRRINYAPNAYLLATDGIAGAVMATNHLLSLGHRRIAALCGPSKMPSERAKGYIQAMGQAGLEPVLYHSADFDRQSTYDLARDILGRSDRPSGLFATFDLAGISVLRAAADCGMRIPTEMAVIGYDNIQEGLYATPRLTTIAQPTEELGRLATRHLTGLVEGRIERTFGMKLISPRLVIRESCGWTGTSKAS